MDTDFGNKEIMDRITRIKHELGNELVILTHHYQRKDIVDLGNHRGDTFALAQRVARDEKAKHIVVCGVSFMAESAAILANDDQTVQIPDPNAGCWMADMAKPEDVEAAWNEVVDALGKDIVTPVAYMNSHVGVKAFCGRSNGAVCSSSNALRTFEWAFEQQEKIFFFPDEHLGKNTAAALNVPMETVLIWDPAKPMGGLTIEALNKAKVILWKGNCQVHTQFTPDQIKTMRDNFPDASIVVHPECPHDVVKGADACGSTSFIVRYITDAPADSTIVVGTEINLIKRLAAEHPDKKILPLSDAFCPYMHKINLKNLATTLENIGQTNIVTLDEKIKKEALTALENMLNL